MIVTGRSTLPTMCPSGGYPRPAREEWDLEIDLVGELLTASDQDWHPMLAVVEAIVAEEEHVGAAQLALALEMIYD
jgi:hypothetical protein